MVASTGNLRSYSDMRAERERLSPATGVTASACLSSSTLDILPSPRHTMML